MTSLLSDMRTVRPQGRTFRITQPHGLRVSYLGTTQRYCKGQDQIITVFARHEARGLTLGDGPKDNPAHSRERADPLSRDRRSSSARLVV